MNNLIDEFNSTKLPERWHSLSEEDKIIFEKELGREVMNKHDLFGRECKALARRYDLDDFLYYINEESKKLVVVHLGFPENPLNSSVFPTHTVYETVKSFIENESF